MQHEGRRWANLAGAALCAAAIGLSMTLGAPGAGAQQIPSELLNPELIDQILGDFVRQRSEATGEPVEQTSPIDAAREQAAKAAEEAARAAEAARLRAEQDEAARAEADRAAATAGFSALELDYTDRLGEPVGLFGYDVFEGPSPPAVLVEGSAPEDYRLGVGDEVVISLVGGRTLFRSARVDSEGRIVLPEIGAVMAAGRSFDEFQREIEERVAATYLDTEAFVSLGAVRSVAVVVLGEVSTPGVHQLTALSSLLDALFAAGGIKRTGSLRSVQVVRGDDHMWFDLYDLLLGLAPGRDMTLRDGDRIIVPPVGATVAVAGKVRRPAIYELAEGQSEASLEDVLAFSGGPLRPSGNRFISLSVDPTGRQQVGESSQGQLAAVADGDIIVVAFSEDVQVGSVFLEGHVRVPGRRSIAAAASVRALLRDVQSLGPAPYLLFAALQTHDPYTHSEVFVPVDLQRVLSGVQDVPLNPEDRLIVLGLEDIRYIWSADVQGILSGGQLAEQGALAELGRSAFETQALATTEDAATESLPVTSETALPAEGAAPTALPTTPTAVDASRIACKGLLSLYSVVSTSRPGRFSDAVVTAVRDLEPITAARLECPEVFDTYPDLLPFAIEHVVAVNGEVRIPGVYPIAPNAPLSNVITYSGGLGRDADLGRVEILRSIAEGTTGALASKRDVLDLTGGGMERVFVSPGDVVRVASRFSDRDEKPILLVGEFVRPGLYQIRRGERLSEVVTRAGGLTPQAYPYGAIFTRERTREAEKQAFERAARELEIALAAALTQRTSGAQVAAGADALRALANQLRNAEPVGRVVIESDPTVLQVRPELDTVLEGGDRLFMPKRPNSVTVIGDVLNEGTLQFVPGARVDEYIDKAGGLRGTADDARVFVVLPNGEAQPVSVSAWNYTPVVIPPGSTVVVPKEPAPFDTFAFIKDVVQITAQLAVTAAALSAIND
jgi:protein involved in polysaccharide export with SLBB domain